jgi:hypothetical protein
MVDSVCNLEKRQITADLRRHQLAEELNHPEAISIDCGDSVDTHYREESHVLVLMRKKQLDAELARYTMPSEREVLLRLAGKAIPTVENEKPHTGELDLF